MKDGLPRGAVIAATELGDSGALALALADEWARKLDAPLVVAHALPTPDALLPLLPHLYRPLPDAERITGAAIAVRAQVSAATRRKLDDYDIAIEQGSPHAAIVNLAWQIAPRLLVIGASQKGPALHALLGSTAEQILRHAPCPVLLARPQRGDGPIVVATDFSDAALPAERAAVEQARLWGKELVVLHALDVAPPLTASFEPAIVLDDTTIASLRESAEKLADATLARLGAANARRLVVLGDARFVVPTELGRLGAWLVVLATHGRTGFPRMALGSVAERIARTAPCPALLVRTHSS